MNYSSIKKSIKYVREKSKDLWWILPFLTFYVGYWAPQFFFKTPSFETPALIGKNIHEALVILSEPQLNVRLIAQKEDPTLPEGTVISQIPAPYQQIKRYQAVFVTVSTKPVPIKTPLCQGKFEKEVTTLLTEQKIKWKSFFVQSNHPSGYCIAQNPSAYEPLYDRTMILYFSKDIGKTVIFPDLQNSSIEDVKKFLNNYGIKPEIFHTKTVNKDHKCTYCTVLEQKPIAGTFVNLKEPFSVQLKVMN